MLSASQWHSISGGKSTQLSYLSKSIDTLIESYSSKSKSRPLKYYLSKSKKLSVSEVNVIAKNILKSIKGKSTNHFKSLILSKAG